MVVDFPKNKSRSRKHTHTPLTSTWGIRLSLSLEILSWGTVVKFWEDKFGSLLAAINEKLNKQAHFRVVAESFFENDWTWDLTNNIMIRYVFLKIKTIPQGSLCVCVCVCVCVCLSWTQSDFQEHTLCRTVFQIHNWGLRDIDAAQPKDQRKFRRPEIFFVFRKWLHFSEGLLSSKDRFRISGSSLGGLVG